MGILSCAKILGAVHAALGLLLVPFFLVVMLVGTLARGASGDHAAVGIALAGSMFFVLFIPVFYGAMGFAMGALGGWAYNFAAKKLGGIQIEIADVVPGVDGL